MAHSLSYRLGLLRVEDVLRSKLVVTRIAVVTRLVAACRIGRR